MDTAPTSSAAPHAPETPKRIAAQVSSGSGAYSSSEVWSGDPTGIANTSTQSAAKGTPSVAASALRASVMRTGPLRRRVTAFTISGTSATTANALVNVRTTTVSQNSFETPNSAKAAASPMLVTSGASRPPNRISVKAVRTRLNERGASENDWTATAPSTASVQFARYCTATRGNGK